MLGLYKKSSKFGVGTVFKKQFVKKNFNQSLQMGNYISANNTLMFHLITLTISWNILANIAVYFALFKHTVKGYYVHAIISWLIIVITVVSTLLYIIPKGIPQQCHISEKIECDRFQFPLAIEGTILTFWLAIQIFTGIFARAWQEYPKARTISVMRSKRVHQFSGYFIMLLGKVNCFIHWRTVPAVWIPLLAWEVFSIIAYVKRKWFFTSFEATVVDRRIFQNNYDVPKIKYIQELKKSKSQYTIFADYVYDISPLMTLHPAGYQIIQVTKGRQIDRFIYGMYGAESLPEVKMFAHPENSFKLVGRPVAKIQNPNPYQNMEQLNQCEISYKELVSSKSQIYIFGLSTSKQGGFKYNGYTEISQIGQYFSLTFNNKVTRLYTTVNCLIMKNRRIMKQIIQIKPLNGFINEIRALNQQPSQQNRDDGPTSERAMHKIAKKRNEISGDASISTNSLIPLMIKVYEDGKLTPELVKQEQKEMTISCTRGQGLKLDTLTPGKLVFICGGTGFYPFMDLVDLLFKRKLINSGQLTQEVNKQLIAVDPLLEQNILNDFSFQFYIALNSTDDILPMTMYQLNYLCSVTQFQCMFKLRDSADQFKKIYRNFKFTTQRFDQFVIPQVISSSTSKTFICGPPIMLTSLIKVFHENQIEQNRFQFV